MCIFEILQPFAKHEVTHNNERAAVTKLKLNSTQVMDLVELLEQLIEAAL